MIRAGRVRLNGVIRRDPETPVHLETDRIEVDRLVVRAQSKIYLMLNKPRGVVTTASDEKSRKTVYEHLGKELPWVAPVGRLDKASEGLLLLTNDSEWGARVMSPETRLEKIYHVQVDARLDEEQLSVLLKGFRDGAGDFLRARRARELRAGERNAWLEIALDEGKNREIRRMLEFMHIEVLRLVRVAIGSLSLGELAKGAYRELTANEKRALDHDMREA